MRVCVRVCVLCVLYVRVVRARSDGVCLGWGGLPASLQHLEVARPEGTWTPNSKWPACLSGPPARLPCSHRPPFWRGRWPPVLSPRGACPPKGRPVLCRNPVHLCVCVGVCVCVHVGVCTVPAAGPQCIALVQRACPGCAPGSAVASSDPCASSGPWASASWGLRGLLCLHVPRVARPGSLRPVWFPACMDYPVLCSVPSATHCPVTIHVATENGCEGKPRALVEVRGEVPLPLPQHTKRNPHVGREQA